MVSGMEKKGKSEHDSKSTDTFKETESRPQLKQKESDLTLKVPESKELQSKLKEVELKLIDSEAKVKELTHLIKHVQADFENFKKRKDAEFVEYRDFAQAELIAKLLPVLDSFELALKSKANKQGMEMIFAQLVSIFEGAGLEEINNSSFDPRLHEALLSEPSDKPNGTVIEVFQKGYKLKGRVIRPARVKVAKQKC